MSDQPDKDSKTEDPSEKKIHDAVEKGNTPVSREVGIFASFLGMLLIVHFIFWDDARKLASFLSNFLERPGSWSFENSQSISTLFEAVSIRFFLFLAPILAILVALNLASSFAQNPPSFVLHRIKPDFSKLSLGKGFNRIFGVQGWVEFAKALFKFTAIGIVVTLFFRTELTGVTNTLFIHPSSLPQTILGMVVRLFSAITVAIVAIVGVDILWSRKQWFKNLMMTKQEVKDERKELDGDPIVKAKRLSIARDRLRRQMIAAVPGATVIITNPTHFSVALAYHGETDAAPKVVAKGKNLIAKKIREIAAENNIPLVENKHLARSLYSQVEINQYIPEEFYQIVAEIIHYVTSNSQS